MDNCSDLEIPSGWVQCCIGEICSEVNSGSGFPKQYQGNKYGDYPFAKVGDISRHFRSGQKSIKSADNYISESIRETIKAKLFPEKTIVFPKIGEALKGNYRVITDCKMLFDNNVMGLTPHPSLIDCKFVFYFLTTQDFGKWSVATAVPSVRRGDIESIRLLLPPLKEQKRIVTKIEELFSELDSGIASLKTAQEKLKVYRQAVLKHAFEGKLTTQWREDNKDKLETPEQLLTRIQQEREARYQAQLAEWETAVEKWEADGKEGKKPSKPSAFKPMQDITDEEINKLPVLPNGWIYARLAEISTIGSGMSVSKDRKLNNPVTVPYLRVANVQRGKLDLTEIKSMQVEQDALEDLRLAKWDVLFNEGGDRDKLGRGWIWENQIDPCITQNHVFKASPLIKSEYHSKFISHWGNSFGKDYFEKGGKQTTNLASINKTVLSNFPVPLLPFNEQEKIIEMLDDTMSQIDVMETELENGIHRAEILRQSILKKAFSGQLVPQDPNDELASELLARIQAEKAAALAQPKPTPVKRARKAKEAAHG